MLRLEKIKKSYFMGQEIRVLRGVSMEFSEKGFTAIRGPSGSGKSTLLHLMGGLDHPTAGEIFWRGEKISEWSNAKRAAWRNASVGFIFQSYHLLPELSALENVLLPAALARKSCEKEAKALLDQVGLKKRAHHRPSELSGGEQQRVAIARALVNNPAMILADEPTGNLDGATAQGIMDLLLDLIEQRKKSLIMVTHDAEWARRASLPLRLSEGILEYENLH
ncbi:MAG: ABC transporter ATP-binding protein [Verrucomicrobiota bacterium]